MKSFNQYLIEILEPSTLDTTDIKPDKETNTSGSIIRSYKTYVGRDEVKTIIDHSTETGKADVKFYVNGVMGISPQTKSSIPVFREVLKHLKHHSQNIPGELTAIRYMHDQDEKGEKLNKIYQELGNRFNVPLEPRTSGLNPALGPSNQ